MKRALTFAGLVALGSCALVLPALGAITVNSTSSAMTLGAASLTWPHTVNNGGNRALFVGISIENSGSSTSISYGGAPMTLVGRTSGSPHVVEIWRLVAPAVGTANIVANFSASIRVVGGATAFDGVEQANPTGAFQGAGGTGTTPSVTVASSVEAIVLDVLYGNDGPTAAPVGPQSAQWNLATGSGNGHVRGGGSTKAGSSSVTMSWTLGSSVEWRIGAVSLSAATATSIRGTIFEDANYGGGAGRDSAAAAGVGRPGARVELYDNSGVFVTSTTSQTAGAYAFPGLSAGNYTVRVVNDSVSSARAGYTTSLKAVQTFRTNASSGTAVDVTNHVGGQDPSVVDAAAGSAGATLNTTTGVFTAGPTGTAQSITNVTLGSSDITGVSFGYCFDVIASTRNAGQGSVRQFILNANALSNIGLGQAGRTAGTEHAIWMISNGTAAAGLRSANNYFSGGVTIPTLDTPLPAISTPMVMDAQTQPGFAGSPIVRLDGNGAGAGANGISIAAGGARSTIRGLMFTRFSNDGMVIQSGARGVTVAGNWMGTDGSGNTALRNANDGLQIFADSALIGGSTVLDRNVIVNNLNEGINIAGAGAGGNVIRGNFIGLEPNGSSGGGNGDVGIALLASGSGGNVIGGLTSADRNVISMNFEGIEIDCPNNVVQGNYFGTDSTGTLDHGQRSSDAVQITSGVNGNLIGGTAAGAGNLIAFTKSGWHGVSVQGGTGNAVQGNRIHSNTGLGIDLGNNGVTLNNGTKNGALANSGMDYPIFTSANLNGTTLTVAGYVGSAPGQATFAGARVEVFKSDNDATGYGEGLSFLGPLVADGSGNFGGTLTVSGLTLGDKITGTATDAAGNTSEFGPDSTVRALSIVKRVFDSGGSPVASGTTLARGTIIRFLLYVDNRGPAVADVRLSDVLDPTFEYVSGTMRSANVTGNCASTSCTTPEESAILTAALTGAALTDIVDGDTGALNGATLQLGKANAGSARLDILANKVYAVVFRARMR